MQTAFEKALQLILTADPELCNILQVTARMSLQSSILALLLGVPLAAAAYRIIRDDVAANLPAAESEAEPPAEPAPAPETASE